MPEDGGPLRWSVERRLSFIELRLYWEGRMNRGDLIRFFGISVPQASLDFARYEALAPGNLVYDKTAKTYVAGPDFHPLFAEPSARAYLAQLRLLATEALNPADAWIGRPPPFAGTPRLTRRYDNENLRRLLRCIRERRQLSVKYVSFSEESSASRVIAPHALGFDGQRWHARAFCLRSATFRDYVLSRLSHLGGLVDSSVDPEWDVEWHTNVTLQLAPNPKLSPAMKAAIERDYDMKHGHLNVSVTASASYYLESQLNLDLDLSHLPPKRQQLVLTNRKELEAARETARQATVDRVQASEYGNAV